MQKIKIQIGDLEAALACANLKSIKLIDLILNKNELEVVPPNSFFQFIFKTPQALKALSGAFPFLNTHFCNSTLMVMPDKNAIRDASNKTVSARNPHAINGITEIKYIIRVDKLLPGIAFISQPAIDEKPSYSLACEIAYSGERILQMPNANAITLPKNNGYFIAGYECAFPTHTKTLKTDKNAVILKTDWEPFIGFAARQISQPKTISFSWIFDNNDVLTFSQNDWKEIMKLFGFEKLKRWSDLLKMQLHITD